MGYDKKPLPVLPWQPLMRAVDVRDLNVEMMFEHASAVGVDSMVVNAAGFMAWYPTKLPYQKINPFMEGDFLSNMIGMGNKYGIQIYGRIDISKGFSEWYKEHSDWYVHDVHQNPSLYWDLHETCFTGDYFQGINFEIVEELLTRYPLDGLFYNFFFVPKCYCKRCQKIVRDATGAQVPLGDMMEPFYERWRHRTLADYTIRLNKHIKSFQPETRLMVYHHMQSGWDPRLMAPAVDIWAAQISNPLLPNPYDHQPNWIYWPGEEAEKGKALKSETPPWLVATYSETFSSRRVLQPSDRIGFQLAQAAAHGALSCAALNGVIQNQEDKRSLNSVDEHLATLASLKEYLVETKNPAKVALIFSPDSLWFGPDHGKQAGVIWGHQTEFRGLYKMLTHMRYPFAVHMTGMLSRDVLSAYDVVVLPAACCLADTDIQLLKGWVEDGGCLISTANSGQWDENANIREQTSCLFPKFLAERNATGGYLSITGNELVSYLGETSIVSIAETFWEIEVADEDQSKLNLIGPFTNNAPEFTYWNEDDIGPTGLTRKQLGKGWINHIPWYPGALYYRVSLPDYPCILKWILDTATPPPPIFLDAPHSVEMVLRRKQTPGHDMWIVHLLNGTSLAEDPLLNTIPVSRLALSTDLPVKDAYLAVSGMKAEMIQNDNKTTILIDELKVHEVVVLRT
jgi:hypothetical protein